MVISLLSGHSHPLRLYQAVCWEPNPCPTAFDFNIETECASVRSDGLKTLMVSLTLPTGTYRAACYFLVRFSYYMTGTPV